MMRPTAAVALLLVLAGCSEPAPADADPSVPGIQDAAPAPFTVVQPPWQAGDWWSHRWVFAGEGGPDFTVKTIVSSNASGTYTFSTDTLDTAAQHGAFFFMDLGAMGPDGVMKAGAYAFPWMQFPLADNKTWTATETNVGDGFAPVTRQLTMAARLNGTPDAPFFTIEATSEGALSARYDYQPALGWFSAFRAYRPDANGTPQLAYTITNEGSGKGYTGPIHDASGEMLVNVQPFIHPGSTNPPAQAIPVALGDATHIFAILFSFGAAGAHHTQLVAPDGQRWEAIGAGDADGNPVSPPGVPSGTLVLAPAQPGQWTVTLAGGGVVAGGGAFVWGVSVTSGTL